MFCIRRIGTPYYSFFFNDTATTEIYTLSLHDALPICHHHFHVHDVLAREGGQRHRQSVVLLVGQHDQRPHEIVPCAHEGEDRQGHQHRLEHRQHDLEEDTQLPCPVDARRLQQFVRNRTRVLAHQEDA